MTSESEEGSASAEVREQIVKAARNCFVRYGTAKTSMADVARDAGVSRGTVYRYFADRAALAEAVFAYESHLFHEGMRRQLDRLDTLEEQVVECAGILAAFEHRVASGAQRRMEVSPERLALLLTSHSEPLLRDTVDFLVPYVKAAQQRGEIRAELNVRAAAEWISRNLFAISSMPAITFRGDDPKAWRRFFRDHLLRGLQP